MCRENHDALFRAKDDGLQGMYSMKDTVAADLGVSLPGRKILKGPLKRPAAKAAVIVEADIEAPKRLDNNSDIGVHDGDDGTQASEAVWVCSNAFET